MAWVRQLAVDGKLHQRRWSWSGLLVPFPPFTDELIRLYPQPGAAMPRAIAWLPLNRLPELVGITVVPHCPLPILAKPYVLAACLANQLYRAMTRL